MSNKTMDDAMKKALLSFVGAQDPLNTKQEEGPILSFLRLSEDKYGDTFEKLYLFHTESNLSKANLTKKAIEATPGRSAVLVPVDLPDPTSHVDILRELRPALARIRDVEKESEVFILASPGTPAMHACWFLAVAAGDIRARLFQTRRPGEPGEPRTEVQFADKGFPIILPRMVEVTRVSETAVMKVASSEGIKGNNPRLVEAFKVAAKVANADINVLITGETGTGKTQLANFIHNRSLRKTKPFGEIIVANAPKDLLESELFGHEKNAFNGAVQRIGLFEKAEGGTIFLDEVCEIPLDLQHKLLDFIQFKRIRRVGGNTYIEVDARLLAATNKNVEQEVQAGRFREDLYHRLNVIRIELPPLREYPDDIPLLATQFLSDFCSKYGKGNTLADSAISLLKQHPWPGNIRELKNTIEASVLLAEDEELTDKDIRFGRLKPASDNYFAFGSGDLDDYLVELQKGILLDALRRGGSQAAAAKLVGISEQVMSNRLDKFDLKNWKDLIKKP